MMILLATIHVPINDFIEKIKRLTRGYGSRCIRSFRTTVESTTLMMHSERLQYLGRFRSMKAIFAQDECYLRRVLFGIQVLLGFNRWIESNELHIGEEKRMKEKKSANDWFWLMTST